MTGSDATPAHLDVIDRARALAGPTADIRSVAGGLEIKVLDEDLFPWAQTYRILVATGQDIWMRSEGGALTIHTKPPRL